MAEPDWLNNTINIDTGCVFGGRLTALRWPDGTVSVRPSASTTTLQAVPRTGGTPRVSDEPRPAELLDIDDVAGKRMI